MAGKSRISRLGPLAQAVDARRCFLAYAFYARGHLRPQTGTRSQRPLQCRGDNAVFFAVFWPEVRYPAITLGFHPEMHEQRGVPAVVDDHVRAVVTRPAHRLLGGPPIFLQRLAFPGEDRHTGRCDGGRGVVLGGEDIAARPPHFGAKGDEGLDQDRGLHGHVQGPADASTGQGPLVCVFGPEGHEAGHLDLGQPDFPPAKRGQRDVGDSVGDCVGGEVGCARARAVGGLLA